MASQFGFEEGEEEGEEEHGEAGGRDAKASATLEADSSQRRLRAVNDHSEHSISNKKMGPCILQTIPDVTWVTSDVRAWLCEHDVKFDKDIGHVALVALAQASASAPAMPTRVPAMPGAGDVSKEAATFDFSTLCPLETAMWTTDFNWGCERAGAAQRAADAGVLRAAEYEEGGPAPAGGGGGGRG